MLTTYFPQTQLYNFVIENRWVHGSPLQEINERNNFTDAADTATYKLAAGTGGRAQYREFRVSRHQDQLNEAKRLGKVTQTLYFDCPDEHFPEVQHSRNHHDNRGGAYSCNPY